MSIINDDRLHYTRGLIEVSLDPLVTISPDGKIMDVNAATEKIIGLPRDQLIGSDFSIYFTHPDKAQEGYELAFAQGTVTDYPLAIKNTNGQITEVIYNASVYRDHNDEIIGVFAAARDITKLKEAESQLRASSHYARSLIEASLDPLLTISPNGRIMDVNLATEKVTGVARNQLIGSDFSGYFTQPDRARAGYQLAFLQGFVTEYPLAIRHTSGQVIDVLYNASVYRDETGQVAGLFAAARDITALKRYQDELENTNHEIQLLRQMTNLLQACQSEEEAYPIINTTFGLLFPESSGACFILKESDTLLEEVSYWGVTPLEEKIVAPEDCWALRRGHIHVVGFDQTLNPRCHHLQNETLPYACVPLLAQGKTLGIITIKIAHAFTSEAQMLHMHNLAQIASDSVSLALANLRLRESLRLLSIHDPLTGLVNRRFMEEVLARELRRMTRLQKSLVIAMLDLDKFKYFNDTYGHEAGDAVLKEVAALFLRFRQGVDLACRYGGEEFILVLPEMTTDYALELMEQLRQAVANLTISYHGRFLSQITVSIGLATFPQHGYSPERLINLADKALYQAKESGRNRTVAYGSSSVPVGVP